MTVGDVKALFARWANTTEHDAYNNMADVLGVVFEEPELLDGVNLGELLVRRRPPTHATPRPPRPARRLPSNGHARPLACLLACARTALLLARSRATDRPPTRPSLPSRPAACARAGPARSRRWSDGARWGRQTRCTNG